MGALRIPSLCQSCGHQGPVDVGTATSANPPWCTCTGKNKGGPYVAPPGVVVCLSYESKEDSAFREECRLAGNAERHARDDLSLRWVRSGRGWRELPRSSPKRRRLEGAYRKALRALEALQARCAHAERSMFSHEHCGVCYAHVETDVEQHRHLVREGFYRRRSAAGAA